MKFKLQIPIHKLQTNYNIQYTMTKKQRPLSQTVCNFGIVICILFVIWNLFIVF